MWLVDVLEPMGCQTIDQLTKEKCKAPLKDKIAGNLYGALLYIRKQNEILDSFKEVIAAKNEEVIKSQRSVVNLQEKLIACKDDQLQSLQSSVTSSVQETFKAEFKTYSEAAAEDRQCSVQSVVPETIKSVVKSVVELEDRSRNIMVFGLPEEENEQLNERVLELCEVLGEKPRLDACRVGKKSIESSSTKRPIKVSLSNSIVVNQILSKARNLRTNEKYRSVFISPDRTEDDRKKQRKLVVEMRRLCDEKPGMRHYIRSGIVISEEKDAT